MGKHKRVSGPCEGVSCYEHESRRHNRKPDKYYLIRYRDAQGKLHEEALGWASQGWNDSKAIKWSSDVRENIRTGKGPQSLREMRDSLVQAQAEEKAAKAVLDRARYTFSDAADDYLDWARSNKSSWPADETRLRLHILPGLGSKTLPTITPTDVEQIKKLLVGSKAPATVRQCLVLIRRVFNFCRQNHGPDGGGPYFSGDCPTKPVQIPPVHNECERFLTRREADHLIETARESRYDMADIIELALHTGLRRNEIQSMQWHHVNLDAGILTIPGVDGHRSKGKGFVQLNSVAKEVLRRRKESRGTTPSDIFLGEDGGKKDISKFFNIIAERAGVNTGVIDPRQRVTFHTCRHTFASWLAMKGTPLLTIKKLMRHRSIEMTMRYAHLIPDVEREAVEQLCACEDSEAEDQRNPS